MFKGYAEHAHAHWLKYILVPLKAKLESSKGEGYTGDPSHWIDKGSYPTIYKYVDAQKQQFSDFNSRRNSSQSQSGAAATPKEPTSGLHLARARVWDTNKRCNYPPSVLESSGGPVPHSPLGSTVGHRHQLPPSGGGVTEYGDAHSEVSSGVEDSQDGDVDEDDDGQVENDLSVDRSPRSQAFRDAAGSGGGSGTGEGGGGRKAKGKGRKATPPHGRGRRQSLPTFNGSEATAAIAAGRGQVEGGMKEMAQAMTTGFTQIAGMFRGGSAAGGAGAGGLEEEKSGVSLADLCLRVGMKEEATKLAHDLLERRDRRHD